MLSLYEFFDLPLKYKSVISVSTLGENLWFFAVLVVQTRV
jgi:hypothetical protein